MHSYTWKIESTDPVTGTMLVKYTFNGVSTTLNVPLAASADAQAHVEKYAPHDQWLRSTEQSAVEPVTVGLSGNATFEAPAAPTTEAVDHVAKSQDNLRTMIKKVLEEEDQARALPTAPEMVAPSIVPKATDGSS